MASPFLLFPVAEQNTQEINNLCLYSLKDKEQYKLDLPQNLNKDFRCVGSSHGWLAFVDENSNPFLLNPFSQSQIYLPQKHTLPSISRAHEQGLRVDSKIEKAVLSGNPSSHAGKYAVVVMYGFRLRTKIAFCRLGDEEWSDLDCEGETYYDVVFCDPTNVAFALGAGPLVESWDLNIETIPTKKMIIQDSCPTTLESARANFPSDLYTSKLYLALSLGQIFLVVRYVGEFVRDDGEVVHVRDTLTDYAAAPLVCPYRTVGFHVFKFDADEKKWIDVASLNDFALFLGGNQSMMVSSVEHTELKRNAIYFTDDYWERIDEDYCYGGHDMGIFRLEDGSIEPILDFLREQKIEPPPFWISLPHDYEY